ncbi:MAG: hypothetical protein ACOCXG_02200 [Nanoarchaeota archaeon]
MTDNMWRGELDLLINKHLGNLINETKEFDYAISLAKDKSKAQMWVAMAILNYKVEKLLTEKNEKKPKLPKDEVDRIVKALESM